MELTPGPWNLRSRVHEYGGGAYAVAGDQVVFVDDGDRCLWQLEPGRRQRSGAGCRWAGGSPTAHRTRRSRAAEGLRRRADRPLRQRWIGVMETGAADRLVAVPLAGG